MIPKLLKTADLKPPDAPLYYLIAANGPYLVKRTTLFTSVSEVTEIAGLERQKPSLRLHFARVPRGHMERIYGFFDWAWREWESEAVVFLYYAPASGTFCVDVPPQTLFRYRGGGRWRTEGRVAYDAWPRPQGFLKLGDAHSHADFPAFFSAQDDRDDSEEGLRIVMGRLDTDCPDLRVSFVAGGTRFHLNEDEVLEPFERPAPPPKEWIMRMRCTYEAPVYDNRP